jgi:hypothetical protein
VRDDDRYEQIARRRFGPESTDATRELVTWVHEVRRHRIAIRRWAVEAADRRAGAVTPEDFLHLAEGLERQGMRRLHYATRARG